MINNSLVTIKPSYVARGVTYEGFYNRVTKMVYISLSYTTNTVSTTEGPIKLLTTSYKPSSTLQFPASGWNIGNGAACLAYGIASEGEIFVYAPKGVMFACTSLFIFRAV